MFEITLAIPFTSEFIVDSERTEKKMTTSLLYICRYRPSIRDSKKNNYVFQAMCFETGTTEDVLH